MYEKLSQGRRPTLPVGVPRTTPAARELAYVPLPPQFQPTSADYHAGQTRIPALAESLAARVADREVDYGNPETTLGEPQIHEVDVQVLLRRRLVDLDEWERWEQRLERRRQQLLRHRERLADRKRDQQATKQHWLATLRQLGLPESLRTRDAHSVWDRVSSAREVHHEHRSAREAYDRDLRQLQEYRSRVESLAGKIHGPGRHDQLVTDYHRTLSDWEQRLHSHTGSRQERARLGQLAEQKRREAESLDSDIERLRGKRQSLLSRAGVASRSELEQRLHDQRRVTDQQAHWESARDELHHIASTEPELAIVEEDLQAFHPERNRQSIESLRRELAEIEEQLPGHHEQLGRFKQELTELEQDRRPSGLRYDRTQLANELQQAVERWAAVQLAGQAIERVRGKVEKTSQPQLLKHASKYLTDLTSGKYHNVWTPLGERHLMIDDDSGQSQRVEHLSSGTREQVFLAVRLAMVKDFADRGADLPMVLDDVFVNFDQVRTESAVRTLLEFADQGQQVLFFTCHLHLAHLFENQGVEPVWLPGHAATVDERRAS